MSKIFSTLNSSGAPVVGTPGVVTESSLVLPKIIGIYFYSLNKYIKEYIWQFLKCFAYQKVGLIQVDMSFLVYEADEEIEENKRIIFRAWIQK